MTKNGDHAGRRSGALDRRRLLAAVAAASLAGCDDDVSTNPEAKRILDSAEGLTRRAQRTVTGTQTLAREYAESEISRPFKPNGSTDPQDAEYLALAAKQFADWRLEIGGLVESPRKLSLDELRALPSRTQITRHDCVEGWSCIGKWKGTQLGPLLDSVKPRSSARYAVFHCADAMEQNMDGSVTRYYESIDLAGAHHPQTILAYEMNDQVLPVAYGAPLRLRDERQLGYKMAKYIMRIELVDNFAAIAGGKGGYWEDQGYEWFAGI